MDTLPTPGTTAGAKPLRLLLHLLGFACMTLAYSCTPIGQDAHRAAAQSAETASSSSESSAESEADTASYYVQAYFVEVSQPGTLSLDRATLEAAAEGDTAGLLEGNGTLDQRLRAAEATGALTVLLAPALVVREGRFSTQTGIQIAVQTMANDTVSVQFVNATLRLDATLQPWSSDPDRIAMELNFQRRRPLPSERGPDEPAAPIQTTEAAYYADIESGGATVIGGLYQRTADGARGSELVCIISAERTRDA